MIKIIALSVTIVYIVASLVYILYVNIPPPIVASSPPIGIHIENEKVTEVNKTILFNATRTGIFGSELIYMGNQTYYPPALFIWDFDDNDGMQVEKTGPVVNYTYMKPGNYTVTLTVIAYGSKTYVDNKTVKVTVI